MKTGLLLLFLAIPFLSIAQTLQEAKKALTKINSLEQIAGLKSQYPHWTIDEDQTMQSDSRFPHIIKAKIGDVVLKQYAPDEPTFVMKVVAKRDEELCKLKYIYLDGSKLSISQIDSLRTVTLAKYKKGEDFVSLVKAYTMDNNPTGNLGWFNKGSTVEEFEHVAFNSKKGEILQ